ncbi:hypothetical protein SDC9_95274 [bioreactor metagenome]|uniref:Superoxide reductase n=1 Tax=bioreactor metagenome TaxID=1076179 RepID=A0A645A5V9_9ZZZZ
MIRVPPLPDAPKPGDKPVLSTTLEGKVTAYELCNLHGYWKGE